MTKQCVYYPLAQHIFGAKSRTSPKEIKLISSGNKRYVSEKLSGGSFWFVESLLQNHFRITTKIMFFSTHCFNLDFDRHAYHFFFFSQILVIKVHKHTRTRGNTHTQTEKTPSILNQFRVNLTSLLRAHASASSFMALKIQTKNIYKFESVLRAAINVPLENYVIFFYKT